MDELEMFSIFEMLEPLEDDDGAQLILKMMREQHPALLLLCNDEHPTEALNDVVCQHIAEYGLKEILDTMESEPVIDKHLYAGAVLVSIKEIRMVKKYIWRDKHFVGAMFRLFKHGLVSKDTNLFCDIVASVIHEMILGGTPRNFLELVENSEIVELYSSIFEKRVKTVLPHTHDRLVYSLLSMCQNSEKIVEKCKLLNTAKSLDAFSQWDELDAEMKDKAQAASCSIQFMVYRDQMPEYKKGIFNTFSEYLLNKNKMCRRFETVRCSYKECTKIQPDSVVERFKKCARCHLALYCSKECQKAHWIGGHSVTCTPPSS